MKRYTMMTQKNILRSYFSIIIGFLLICLLGCEKDENDDQDNEFCPSTFKDYRDGQEYKAVKIFRQCWMAENLNIGTKINSTQSGRQQQDNGTIDKYCYDNDVANCEIYGGLYEWREAMQYVYTEGTQGICPTGWHIPTDGELNTLTIYLGGSSVAGGKMKSTGTIEAGTGLWHDPNSGATNESGFSGLPGGDRYGYSGSFGDLGNYGYFWSSSHSSTDNSRGRFLNYNSTNVHGNDVWSADGFSVRCLMDTLDQSKGY